MRILHLGKFFAPFAGGIENFMFDLLRQGAARGLAQAAVVHAQPGEAGAELTFPFLEAFRRVPSHGQFVYVPLSPGYGRALARVLAAFRPDVIHAHMPNASAFWLLASRRAARVPWVVHWHSDVVGPGLDRRLSMLYPAYRPFEQALLRRSAAVIATSPPYRDSSPALAPWLDRSRVVPLGLDEARLSDTDPAGIDWRLPGRLRVLAVGRLARYKGLDVLVRAARDVAGVELIVAGAGERRAALAALIGAENDGRIRLAGAVSDGVRNRLMRSCDVFCLPSRNRAEAFGMALLEAMAAGRPVIATRVPGSGMEWLVDEERTGWLVEPDDVDGLAALLSRLQAERGLLEPAGARARSDFQQRFRIDAVAERVFDVYRDVLRGSGVAARG